MRSLDLLTCAECNQRCRLLDQQVPALRDRQNYVMRWLEFLNSWRALLSRYANLSVRIASISKAQLCRSQLEVGGVAEPVNERGPALLLT